MSSVLPDYALSVAFNEIVDGLFTVDGSALDGTDGLSDRLLFAGTFDDVSADVNGPISVVFGTDQLAGSVQPATLTVALLDPDDLSKWNPNNPASPLNGAAPGFTPMRPVQLTATVDGVVTALFTGWISRADWESTECTCTLYCEDLLMRAARVFPVIASTGSTTTGTVMGLLFAAVGYVGATSFDRGDDLDDFTADGTVDVVTIIGNLLAAERGTVYIAGDGTPTYESRSRVRCRDAAATLSDELTGQQGGIDIQSIFTRATVTSTAGGTSESWTSIDAGTERTYGRADLPAISSDYIPDGAGQLLADELVFESKAGKPPITITVDSESSDTVALMLAARPLTVYTIDETLGGTDGDYAAQRIEHTITSSLHQLSILATARASREMTVDGSAIDGPDGLRY